MRVPRTRITLPCLAMVSSILPFHCDPNSRGPRGVALGLFHKIGRRSGMIFIFSSSGKRGEVSGDSDAILVAKPRGTREARGELVISIAVPPNTSFHQTSSIIQCQVTVCYAQRILYLHQLSQVSE